MISILFLIITLLIGLIGCFHGSFSCLTKQLILFLLTVGLVAVLIYSDHLRRGYNLFKNEAPGKKED